MEEKLTLTQVLEITVGMLEEIEVPMKYMDQIGIPVAKSINNIKICIDAMNQNKFEQNTEGENNA